MPDARQFKIGVSAAHVAEVAFDVVAERCGTEPGFVSVRDVAGPPNAGRNTPAERAKALAIAYDIEIRKLPLSSLAQTRYGPSTTGTIRRAASRGTVDPLFDRLLDELSD